MAQEIKIHQKKNFIHKYAMALIIGGVSLILALTLSIVGISAARSSIQVGGTAVIFIPPVANATISKDYSDTELQYNTTLVQWEAHKAVDYHADEGAQVVAVYDGKVLEASNNYLSGNFVVIEHKDGLKTTYKSLSKTLKVKKGDIVKTGTVLGTISTSAANESSMGAHLHFEVRLNDKLVNPNDYFKQDK